MAQNEEQFLKELGYHILEFDRPTVSRIGNRLGSKTYKMKLALKQPHIPDDFFEYPDMADEHTVMNVFNDEFTADQR